MARKPTRFWHPLRRVLRRAREHVDALRARDEPHGLADHRPRLQHYMRAMYGDDVVLEALVTKGKPPGMLSRAIVKVAGGASAQSESEAQHIRLPLQLPVAKDGAVTTLEQYRVLAVQHAERIRRGTALHAKALQSDLERDLFELAESVAIDAHIRENQPGLGGVLEGARVAALAERPVVRAASVVERRVEALLRTGWSANGGAGGVPDRPAGGDAASNAQWARLVARVLEGQHGVAAVRAYRRVKEITLWGTSIVSRAPEGEALPEDPRQPDPASQSPKSPSGRQGRSSSSSSSNRAGPTPSSDARAKPTDPPPDAPEEGDSADGAITENPASPESKSEDTSNDQGASGEVDGAPARDAAGESGGQAGAVEKKQQQEAPVDDNAYRYPEWDCYAQDFRAQGAVVRVSPAPLSSPEWAEAALRDHVVQVHQAKRHFERLRSQRLRLRRQVHGDELDLEACVEWVVDRRMRVAPSDRLYSLVRPGRRELAITLLIDASASTRDDVVDQQRVIDIERIAALIATAAFDGLGDDYSILTFSSASANNVRMHTLKAFGEKSSPLVHQRIGAVSPGGTTRLGAAVRHATAGLAAHPAPYRLLLILSDGKPYDYDWYFSDYAIQDSRRAVLDARALGIHPFCITVDKAEGEEYLPVIFGASGYRVVRRPQELPRALLSAVSRLVTN